MVPLRDENPIQITPYVTYALIALNFGIFCFELSLSPVQLNQFFQHWAVVPQELTTSFNHLSTAGVEEWATLFTSQFLHGGFLHLGGNMLYLWIFGNNLEEQLGRLHFLLFYLLCGALAVLTQWYFNPLSAVPSLGASGAIAGVMGAYLLRFPKVKILTLLPLGIYITTLRIPALLYLGFWFLQQAFYGVASLEAPATIGMEGGGIAYWAHAGGFLFGAVLGLIFGLLDHSIENPTDSSI
ncbi:MAG: rhomboid family intramembrane serine protease [Acaryochloridaceae cyanobacterium SU_2_1]|nr:rhomboid family intramembrane serine protease [Acaryochloridaceae cyanobacterium SU_2_1]